MSRRTSHQDARPVDGGEDLALARSLWPALRARGFRADQYRLFLDFYSSDAADIEMRFHLPQEDTMKAVEAVVKSKDRPLAEIKSLIKECYDAVLLDDTPSRVLEMILRQWTMLEIQVGKALPGTLTWEEGTTICSTVRLHFEAKKHTNIQEYAGDIDGALTAACLVKDHDVQIAWTNIISEHLSWDRKTRVLKLFEHKIWVKNHLQFPETSAVDADVLEELLLTMNLLFPNVDSPTKALLAKEGMQDSFYGLGYCYRGCGRSLDWNRYKYWRREIQVLVAMLDEPPPGPKQFFHLGRENRNLLNLTLFWMSGVAVLILTIVSSVCGILGLIYARESRDLAVIQLQLSLLQTCNDTGGNAGLSDFCYKQEIWLLE